jgi:hypothetical protein
MLARLAFEKVFGSWGVSCIVRASKEKIPTRSAEWREPEREHPRSEAEKYLSVIARE